MQAWLALPKNRGRVLNQQTILNWFYKVDVGFATHGKPASERPGYSGVRDTLVPRDWFGLVRTIDFHAELHLIIQKEDRPQSIRPRGPA